MRVHTFHYVHVCTCECVYVMERDMTNAIEIEIRTLFDAIGRAIALIVADDVDAFLNTMCIDIDEYFSDDNYNSVFQTFYCIIAADDDDFIECSDVIRDRELLYTNNRAASTMCERLNIIAV